MTTIALVVLWTVTIGFILWSAYESGKDSSW